MSSESAIPENSAASVNAFGMPIAGSTSVSRTSLRKSHFGRDSSTTSRLGAADTTAFGPANSSGCSDSSRWANVCRPAVASAAATVWTGVTRSTSLRTTWGIAGFVTE
jgi:hypothetical protein